jgi:peroxiredoxin
MRSLRGKVVYVNFWATSCTTCIKEMPEVIKTYQRFAPRRFELLAVAMSYDPPEYVRNYTQQHRLPFKVVLDTRGDIARAFDNVALTPTAVIIDKQGRVLRRIIGEPDFAALHALIDKELAA